MTAADQIRFDDPHANLPDTTLQRLAARFGGHAYDLHRHETYAVGLTLWGAQSFHYRGELRTSRDGQVMVIHPDEAHDGHATVDAGFAYRMLDVEPASVSAALEGASPPFVRDVVADLGLCLGRDGQNILTTDRRNEVGLHFDLMRFTEGFALTLHDFVGVRHPMVPKRDRHFPGRAAAANMHKREGGAGSAKLKSRSTREFRAGLHRDWLLLGTAPIERLSMQSRG